MNLDKFILLDLPLLEPLMKLTALCSAAVLALASVSAQAATSANFNVKITIQATCDVTAGAASNVDFGTALSTSTNVDQQSSINVNCTPGTAYTVALGDGLNSSSTLNRRMLHASLATTYVPYSLYLDAARQNAWGSTLAQSYSGVGSGSSQSINVYGRVPSANYPAGSYQDTVTATVSF